VFSAFFTAVGQLGDPPIKRVIWRVAFWTALIYMLVGIALWSVIAGFDPTLSFAFVPFLWLQSLLVGIAGFVSAILGLFAFFAVFWLLFVIIVQLVAGFYLEDIITAVEARHYPDLPPAIKQTASGAALNALQYFATLVLLNLLALPFYLIPLLGVLLFYLVNGYLIGREYYELVALRRIDAKAAKTLRKAERGKVFGAGLITTVLFSLPILNLVAPIVATAAMVHIFEGMAGRREAIEADQSFEDTDV
jgi:uncharacterized protein involved in cysteine biosynthesis